MFFLFHGHAREKKSSAGPGGPEACEPRGWVPGCFSMKFPLFFDDFCPISTNPGFLGFLGVFGFGGVRNLGISGLARSILGFGILGILGGFWIFWISGSGIFGILTDK